MYKNITKLFHNKIIPFKIFFELTTLSMARLGGNQGSTAPDGVGGLVCVGLSR